MSTDGYSMKDIEYKFKEKNSMGHEDNSILPGFNLEKVETREDQINLSTGNYSRIQAILYHSRNISGYVARIYLPMTMLVLLSFTSFLITSSIVRVLVSLFSLSNGIILIAISTAVVIPKTGHLTSLDYFNVICLIFMAIAFVVTVLESGSSDSSDSLGKTTIFVGSRGGKLTRLFIPVLFLAFLVVYTIITKSLQ